MDIKITLQDGSSFIGREEKELFGEKNLNELDLLYKKRDEKGLYFKPNYGYSLVLLLLPAKECVIEGYGKGKFRHYTFDSDVVEKFLKDLPFNALQAKHGKDLAFEIKTTLEQTMDIKIETDDNLKITKTKGKNLGHLFIGYTLEQLMDNANLAVNAAQDSYRQSEKTKLKIKKQFDNDMKKQGAIKDFY